MSSEYFFESCFQNQGFAKNKFKYHYNKVLKLKLKKSIFKEIPAKIWMMLLLFGYTIFLLTKTTMIE